MGGIDVTRDGGAHHETVRVLFEKIIANHIAHCARGGDNISV